MSYTCTCRTFNLYIHTHTKYIIYYIRCHTYSSFLLFALVYRRPQTIFLCCIIHFLPLQMYMNNECYHNCQHYILILFMIQPFVLQSQISPGSRRLHPLSIVSCCPNCNHIDTLTSALLTQNICRSDPDLCLMKVWILQFISSYQSSKIHYVATISVPNNCQIWSRNNMNKRTINNYVSATWCWKINSFSSLCFFLYILLRWKNKRKYKTWSSMSLTSFRNTSCCVLFSKLFSNDDQLCYWVPGLSSSLKLCAIHIINTPTT